METATYYKERKAAYHKLTDLGDGWFGVPCTKDWYDRESFIDFKKELLRILDLCKDFDHQFDEKFLPIINELNEIPFIVTDKSCTGHSKDKNGYLSIYVENMDFWEPILQQLRPWVDCLQIDNVIPYPKITFRWECKQFNEVIKQLLEILPNVNLARGLKNNF